MVAIGLHAVHKTFAKALKVQSHGTVHVQAFRFAALKAAICSE